MSKIQKAHNLMNLISSTIVVVLLVCLVVLALPIKYLISGPPKLKLDSMPPINFKTIDYTQKDHGYMIRLHASNGEFYCSAFVISDTYAITAAHCLVESMDFPVLKEDNILIYNDKLRDTKVIAKAAAVNPRADYGVVIGDFRRFTKAKIDASPGGAVKRSPALMTCGFPWGAQANCYYLKTTGNFFSQLSADGIMFPGMSGGPVVDAVTNEVFAVNSAVTDGKIILSPLVGFFETLNIPAHY